MGGITGFSSLADGYIRLDPSGRGKQSYEFTLECPFRLNFCALCFRIVVGRPDEAFFEQPIKSNDHPFLRQFAHADQVRNAKGQLEPSKEAKSQQRQQGESELDYYERRYQERVFI
jgi:hypothetical protein